MLPKLQEQQNVFFEITNPVHGGPGWELGTTLWSPLYDKSRKTKAWKIMESVNPNDFILHLVKIKGKYHWTGMSIVSSASTEIVNEPPKAGPWSGLSPYQRVSLERYTCLRTPQPVSDFFERYDQDLRKEFKKGSFYVIYGKNKTLRVGQRYLAKSNSWLYTLFSVYSELLDFTPDFTNSFKHSPSSNEPSHPDYSAPGRVETVVSRIVRDTKLSRSVKENHEWKCQVCGERILLPNGKFYAEGHHIIPLGGGHLGHDLANNIIVLCPSHHTEFDYGCIAIAPKTQTIIHVDKKNKYHNMQIAYKREDLSLSSLDYHFSRIFNGGDAENATCSD